MLSDKTKHQLIRVLQQAINRNEVAGANILVYKDGEEVFYHEAGMRQVQKTYQSNGILYSVCIP